MDEQRQIFGDRLRELRKEKRLRQDDIAVDLNVTRQTISKYERGERQPDYCMLIKIAEYFQVSIDYLFGRTPIRPVSRFDEREYFYSFTPPMVADEPAD